MSIAMNEDYFQTIHDEAYVDEVEQKWYKYVREIKDAEARGLTAFACEMQASYLKSLQEGSTTTANIATYARRFMPILRRVVPNLIANKLVSVQPIKQSIGLIFYLDGIYGSSKGATTAGNIFPKDFDADYSSSYINGEIIATGDGTNYGGVGAAWIGNLAYKPVYPLDTTRGFSVIIKELDATTGADVQVATDDGAGGFTGAVLSGTINYSNGSITNFKFTNAPVSGNPIKCYYSYNMELNSQIPEMNLDIKKVTVEAQSRKLKGIWSTEAAEDFLAYHGESAEAELIQLAASEMALGIDREIVGKLFAASTGTTATFDRVPPAGIAEIDHLRGILTPLSTVSNLIQKKTLRAKANFVVTSPEISALLAQLITHGDYEKITSVDTPTGRHGQFGVYEAGVLSNSWKIYVDPFFTRDMMLIGLKGNSKVDAGFCYSPYIPIQVTDTFLDPSDMSIRKGFRTRYATKLLRPEYYGQMRVLNL